MTSQTTITVAILRLSGVWHSGRGDALGTIAETIESSEVEAGRPLNCGGELLRNGEDSET